MRALPVLTAGLVALVVAGCGSSNNSKTTASTAKPATGAGGKVGGDVTILESAGGVDSLDPGYWYYQNDYEDLLNTTQRTLFSWGPTDKVPVPDLATGPVVLSNGGKTITVTIRSGIHYSPPLQSQTVQAADIKYAMERCFAAGVSNGYALTYFSALVGAPKKPTPAVPNIAGIQAPNPTTLVINTTVPVGVMAVPYALTLACTVPVPQAYAAKFDKSNPSTYGMHQVFVGPYMISGAGTGTVPSSGYQTGKLLALVRNPSEVKSTDPLRPAYFNTITFKGGNDITVGSQQILSGSHMMSGDYAVPPTSVLQAGLTGPQKDQFTVAPSGGIRFVNLNTTIKPLDNVNFRRAIGAVLNRTAMRLTRGGPAVGEIATHFLPPSIPGFDQAGGAAGDPADDWLTNPNGNLALAESYMKKAGYPSGKYTGPPLLMFGDNIPPAKNTVEAVQSQLATIGITVTLREVPRATLLSKYCEVPKAAVAICPTLGWSPDFLDGQGMIDPVFNGKNIVPVGNTNMSQANDPTLNKEMDAAEQLTDPTARATAWANIDKGITSQAFVIPFLWDNEVNFTSKDVQGVDWAFNGNAWDLTSSYVK